MKRKAGEIFNYHGLKMQVVATDTCRGCYFSHIVGDVRTCWARDIAVTGDCIIGDRDNEWVKFVLLGVVG